MGIDEFGLNKIDAKILENDTLIEQLTKLSKKSSAPKNEINIVIQWLQKRQKVLNKRFHKRQIDACEYADMLSTAYKN